MSRLDSRILRPLLLALLIGAARLPLHAQNERNGIKLVVLIAVDQFRADYLTRFQQYYSDSGFKWIMRNGSNFTQAAHRCAVTLTGPGHATLSTGCYPDKSGIVLNDWWDRTKQKMVYCVEDSSAGFAGMRGLSKLGQRSPVNLLASTIGDELKNASPDSKVVTVSIKDRAAILLGGAKANGAFWFDDRTGAFVTSTYYMKELPIWLIQYNGEKQPDRWFGKTWDLLLDEKAYARCDADDVPYELDEYGLGRVFPRKVTGGLAAPDQPYYRALIRTPFGNDLLLDFARQMLLGEQLASRGCTDFLGISLSSIDEIGHAFGPDSREMMDACVRLDRQIAQFLRFLESAIGLKNCCIVLASDHGVTPIPEYLKSRNRDGGRIAATFGAEISAGLDKAFGPLSPGKKWIESDCFPWIYLRREALLEKQKTLPEFEPVMKELIRARPGVADVVSRQDLEFAKQGDALFSAVEKAYDPRRCGDYFVALKPGYILSEPGERGGATHGSPNEDDTRVPLLIAAPNASRGTVAAPVGAADLAPTLAKILAIPFPGPRDGKVLPIRITAVKPKAPKGKTR